MDPRNVKPLVLGEQFTACRLLVWRLILAGRYGCRIRGSRSNAESRQDLKDFARSTGQLDVVYSETGRNDSKG